MTSQQQPKPSSGHVFISYVREDSARVDRLERELQDAGLQVWRDVNDIAPGKDWQIEVKAAINTGAVAFLACFSSNSEDRVVTYQREELILAAEQMRRRAPGKVWLVPVRFDDCTIPEYSLGAGRTFENLNRVDLFDDTWPQVGRLIDALKTWLSTNMGTGKASPPPP